MTRRFRQCSYCTRAVSGLRLVVRGIMLVLFLGIIPGMMELEGAFSTSRFPSLDHKSIYVEQVPEFWAASVEFLEDRYRNNPWRSKGGVDLLALLRAAFLSLANGSLQGGSTLPVQLVRSSSTRRPQRAAFP